MPVRPAKIVATAWASVLRPPYRGGVSGHHDGEGSRSGVPPERGFPPVGRESAGDDVLEHGSGRMPALRWPKIPRLAVFAAVAALLVGLVAGYAAGDRHGRGNASPPPTTAGPALAVGGYTLGQSGNQCSAQIDGSLQLGVQVTNGSSAALTLGNIKVILPMGGLRPTTEGWGPCGQLPAMTEDPPQNYATDQYLPPGASTWLTVTVTVLATCPGPLPVQFMVSYDEHGKQGAVQLPGFADLGHVPYRNCPVR